MFVSFFDSLLISIPAQLVKAFTSLATTSIDNISRTFMQTINHYVYDFSQQTQVLVYQLTSIGCTWSICSWEELSSHTSLLWDSWHSQYVLPLLTLSAWLSHLQSPDFSSHSPILSSGSLPTTDLSTWCPSARTNSRHHYYYRKHLTTWHIRTPFNLDSSHLSHIGSLGHRMYL